MPESPGGSTVPASALQHEASLPEGEGRSPPAQTSGPRGHAPTRRPLRHSRAADQHRSPRSSRAGPSRSVPRSQGRAMARDERWTSACGSSGRRLMRLDNEVCDACESTCGSFHRSKAGGRWAGGRRRRARAKARKEGRKMVVGWDEVLWGKGRCGSLAVRRLVLWACSTMNLLCLL